MSEQRALTPERLTRAAQLFAAIAPALMLGAVWALVGCTLGTISEDELMADYQVEPDDDPTELLQDTFVELADELDVKDARVLELSLYRTGHVSIEAQHPGEKNRIYSFRYDGFWMDEGGLETTDTDGTLESRLFTINDVPVEQLPDLIEVARAQMTFAPASFNSIELERADEPPWQLRMAIQFRSFDAYGSVTFDSAGDQVY